MYRDSSAGNDVLAESVKGQSRASWGISSILKIPGREGGVYLLLRDAEPNVYTYSHP